MRNRELTPDQILQALRQAEAGTGLPAAAKKNADAFRKISFARRNSFTSRSSCFRRSTSVVVRPGRWPVSRSTRRIQDRSVSGLQPIFSAIDLIAAHGDGCAGACSPNHPHRARGASGE